MRLLITSFFTAFMLFFSGCNGSSKVVPNTGLEGQNVNTYFIGEYFDVDESQKILRESGFKVLSMYESVKKGTTIVFTTQELQAEAKKEGKGHVAALRLFVDNKEKMISITNPIYFGKAYMQDDYNHAVFSSVAQRISEAFPGLKESADNMEFDKLRDFQFMTGMAQYGDFLELGVATNEELLQKARTYKKGKSLLFELKLSDNSYILGYDLGRKTKKFVKKIGRQNAAILPYLVLIEDGKATMLDPKYYIALSYPLLTMTEFTTIALYPGSIEKDLLKVFK